MGKSVTKLPPERCAGDEVTVEQETNLNKIDECRLTRLSPRKKPRLGCGRRWAGCTTKNKKPGGKYANVETKESKSIDVDDLDVILKFNVEEIILKEILFKFNGHPTYDNYQVIWVKVKTKTTAEPGCKRGRDRVADGATTRRIVAPYKRVSCSEAIRIKYLKEEKWAEGGESEPPELSISRRSTTAEVLRYFTSVLCESAVSHRSNRPIFMLHPS
ncbi:hypothetical protein EVAR_20280_1 [Eumeta japonica]|uniref:Uncharacterized protein n=1 Tax=Eumeta variegata TaxID=151549 RepID=A0A4C1VPP8_EUMVA|nr:hypothetical protein EVAR_20280_1 [Eumeta japonica]